MMARHVTLTVSSSCDSRSIIVEAASRIRGPGISQVLQGEVIVYYQIGETTHFKESRSYLIWSTRAQINENMYIYLSVGKPPFQYLFQPKRMIKKKSSFQYMLPIIIITLIIQASNPIFVTDAIKIYKGSVFFVKKMVSI